MKLKNLKNSSRLLCLFLFAVLIITSCKDDDDEPTTPLVEDGVYIKVGTEELDTKNLMTDASRVEREG